MKRVQSKHIVKVEEVFRRGDMEYIVMELAEMDMLELVNGEPSIKFCGSRWFALSHFLFERETCAVLPSLPLQPWEALKRT
jgi:hypothetical protein